MRWKECNWPSTFCAYAFGLASVATILRREHEPLLLAVEVALRPTVVLALLQQKQLFRGQLCSVLGLVKSWLIL
jgi:hypothetical protein